MSDRLPPVKPRDLIEALERKGWRVDRIRGSHHVLIHPEERRAVTIPAHGRELKRGTLFGILRVAGRRASKPAGLIVWSQQLCIRPQSPLLRTIPGGARQRGSRFSVGRPRHPKSSRIDCTIAIAWRTPVAAWMGVTGVRSSGHRLSTVHLVDGRSLGESRRSCERSRGDLLAKEAEWQPSRPPSTQRE
jgi:predicted RNA binding protein YcfA (HicA-like mRNA interferase family)